MARRWRCGGIFESASVALALNASSATTRKPLRTTASTVCGSTRRATSSKDSFAVKVIDDRHNYGEDRFVPIGAASGHVWRSMPFERDIIIPSEPTKQSKHFALTLLAMMIPRNYRRL
jgi:hypothetical protein